jgi:hypothetical protein
VWRVPRRSGGSSPAAVPSFSPFPSKVCYARRTLAAMRFSCIEATGDFARPQRSGTAVQLVFRIKPQ